MSVADTTPVGAGVTRTSRTVEVVLTAILLGILAQLLFYGTGLGINLPLALGTLLVAAWILRPTPARPRWRDAWLPAAGLLLATGVALRGDVTLAVLDTLGALALVGASLGTFGGAAVVDRTLGGLTTMASRLAVAAGFGIASPLVAATRRLPTARWRQSRGPVPAILRGLVIVLPLFLLFVALFSAADAVFARVAGDLTRWHVDLGSLPGRVLVAAFGAWLAGGLLAFVAAGEARVLTDASAWPDRPRLGTTEAVTALVVLDLLFAGFAALQAAYLFGGLDTLQATGMTYAEYARRGFFELLAVAMAVGVLVLAVEALVARRSRAYLVAAIGLVLLTGVVLASAFLRLRLYQDAYGWTELRFYVLAAICWLALGAAAAVVALVSDRSRWLVHGVIGLSIAAGLVLNVVGPVRFVAEQNLARAIHPELVAAGGETGLDAAYLATLGDDALIVLAEALPRLPVGPRAEVEGLLQARAVEEFAGAGSWQAWNLSHERARELLSR